MAPTTATLFPGAAATALHSPPLPSFSFSCSSAHPRLELGCTRTKQSLLLRASRIEAFDGLKMKKVQSRRRRTLVCAVEQNAEEEFKKTVGVDYLIDALRVANPAELPKLVAENVLAFDTGFWLRLAARGDTCKSEDDKAWLLTWLILTCHGISEYGIKDYEELAATLMGVVDRFVHKTNETIDSSTDVLKEILKPVVDPDEEVIWPPTDPQALEVMKKFIIQKEQEGELNEGFLSEVNAQLRNAEEDTEKPGLTAMLQKVLQFYASATLSRRSYAKKGNKILKDEQFLETIIKAPEEEWNRLLLEGLTVAKGDVTPDELYAVIKKRVERVMIRTEGGSYQQRILGEYLKNIKSRVEEIVKVVQGQT
ncbi:hypothetical protein LINPERHAP2_LOCUS30555 [Linum perenne]